MNETYVSVMRADPADAATEEAIPAARPNAQLSRYLGPPLTDGSSRRRAASLYPAEDAIAGSDFP